MKTNTQIEFKITPTPSLLWDSDISAEGFKDDISDFFHKSLKEEDIKKAQDSLSEIKKVADADIKEKGPVILINDNETTLKFYTKNGQIIRSFKTALEQQLDNLGKLTRAISKLDEQINKVGIEGDELRALEDLNDSQLMPVFNSVSRLSFLDSIFIRYVANKSIDGIDIRHDTTAKKLELTKKSKILAFLGGTFYGGAAKASGFITLLGTVNVVLKFTVKTMLKANLAALGIYTLLSIKTGIKQYKEAGNYNNRADKRFFEIVEAAQIDSNDFQKLTDDLYSKSTELLEVITKFHKTDIEYKKSNTKLTRDMLRNARSLSVIGIKVINSQGKFYRSMWRKK